MRSYINRGLKRGVCVWIGMVLVLLQCCIYINARAESVSDNTIVTNIVNTGEIHADGTNAEEINAEEKNAEEINAEGTNGIETDLDNNQGTGTTMTLQGKVSENHIPGSEDKDHAKDETLGEDTQVAEGDSTVSENSIDAVKILFVGNSFTRRSGAGASCSVPSWLRKISEKTQKKVFVQSVAHNGAKLRYYTGNDANDVEYYMDFITKLESQKWDYVVLQEQSLNPILNYESEFETAVTSLGEIIKKKAPQAEILLYMTHGYDAQAAGYSQKMNASAMEISVGAAYQKMGKNMGYAVVPVGMQFYRYSLVDKNNKLISLDAKHPTPLGYLLSACCFYQQIFGDIPETGDDNLKNWGLSRAQWDILRELVKGQITTNNADMLKMTGREFTMKVNSDVEVKYYSTNPQIASVDSVTGKITTKKNGTTIIYAQTKDGRQAFLNLQVADDIPFGRTEYVVSLHDKIQILPREWKGDLTWKSTKDKIAVVDQNGYIYPKKAGKVKIIAYAQKNKKIKGAFTLFVCLPYVKNVKVSVSGGTTKSLTKESVRLTWSKTDGAEQYKIYRSKHKNSGYRLIGTVKKTSFTDEKCPVNQKVYYKVLAVNKYKYCRSQKYKVVSGRLDKILGQKVIVKGKIKNQSAGVAVVSWKKNKNVKGYIVYRADRKDGIYKKIANIKDKKITSYRDTKRKKNKSYFYKVVGYEV